MKNFAIGIAATLLMTQAVQTVHAFGEVSVKLETVTVRDVFAVAIVGALAAANKPITEVEIVHAYKVADIAVVVRSKK
jgi:hypothetical protein